MTARRGDDKILAQYLLSEEMLLARPIAWSGVAAHQADKKLKNKENSIWPKANHYKTPS